MRRIAVLDAPSNLGLRPPTATSVPGCAKAPGAFRDHGLLWRLGARDAGCVTPPRYDPGDWRPGDGVAHAEQIAWYSRRLADRIGSLLDAGEFPVVLGGDCSILLGSALAANRRSSDLPGQVGLVFIDGHSDFRHPGNASYVGAAAGEDLALVTGRGQGDLAAIENRRPYFRDDDVVVLGIRTHDEHRLDLHAAGIAYRAVPQLRAEGAARSAQWARGLLSDCLGYWVHIDVDVLDPAVMPAVDAPDAGGIAYTELELLLAGLVATPHCLGVEITVFDPDYDPTGVYAGEIVETLVVGLSPAATVTPLDWSSIAAASAPAVAPDPATDPAGSDEPDGLEFSASPAAPVSPAPVSPAAPVSAAPVSSGPVSPVEPPIADAPASDPGSVSESASISQAPGSEVSTSDPPDAGPAEDQPATGTNPEGVGDDRQAAASGGIVAGDGSVEPPDGAVPTARSPVRRSPVGESKADEPAPPPTRRPQAEAIRAEGSSGRPERREPGEKRSGGNRAPAVRRYGLDRMSIADMEADRLALSRRRSGGGLLRRREAATDKPAGADQQPAGGAEADSDPEPGAETPAPAGTAPDAAEHGSVETGEDLPRAADESPEPGQSRPFAGLADQVRAAGSTQVPSARTSLEPPAVPATPPAESA